MAMTYSHGIQNKMAGSKNLSASCTMMPLSLTSFAYSYQIIATGGADGIKIWNVRWGQLKAFIPTEMPITRFVWSPYRCEIMAGYGDTIGIWSEVTQLAEWSFHKVDGHVLTLQHVPNSGTVVSLHQGEVLIGWDAFGDAPKLQRNHFLDGMRGSGILEMPVIR
jgi:WD40 repeat protein